MTTIESFPDAVAFAFLTLTEAHVDLGGTCMRRVKGARKSVDMSLLSALTFDSDAPPSMQGTVGHRERPVAGSCDWRIANADQTSSVPGSSSVPIRLPVEPYSHVGHFD